MPELLRTRKSNGLALYSVLRDRVRETLLAGQRKIEEAKVMTYWNTGRYIKEHTPKRFRRSHEKHSHLGMGKGIDE